VHAPLPADDPLQRCPDITCARELLGWEPAVRLEDGLRRTIDYFDAELGARSALSRPRFPNAEPCTSP
jgi:UDP-glucuronate decarboxylase